MIKKQSLMFCPVFYSTAKAISLIFSDSVNQGHSVCIVKTQRVFWPEKHTRIFEQLWSVY